MVESLLESSDIRILILSTTGGSKEIRSEEAVMRIWSDMLVVNLKLKLRSRYHKIFDNLHNYKLLLASTTSTQQIEGSSQRADDSAVSGLNRRMRCRLSEMPTCCGHCRTAQVFFFIESIGEYLWGKPEGILPIFSLLQI